MIRLAWLQSRTQAAVAMIGLAMVAVVMILTGPHLAHLYHTTIAPCAANNGCSDATTAKFLRTNSNLKTWLGLLVLVVPAIVGIFWGAPLVARELDSGTYRLAWSQGVTRTRWLTVKFVLIGLTSMAVAGLSSLMTTWWASPLDKVALNRFTPDMFDQRGVVAMGYAAFAFALGVTAGVIIRRTLPAMAVTVGVFIVASLVITHSIRPNLMGPAHRDVAITASSIDGIASFNGGPDSLQLVPPDLPNAWLYSAQLVDRSGHAIPSDFIQRNCPSATAKEPPPGAPGGGPGLGGSNQRAQAPPDARTALRDCATKAAANFHEVVTYQPASRYWAFQWDELGILLGASLVLGGVSVWWVRHRLS
jgi:hypothetical protein